MSNIIFPTASLESEILTVPNTPRSDETNPLPDDQNLDTNGQAASCATPSSDDTYRHRDYDIQPTWPTDTDFKKSKINSSAYWQLNQELCDIFLDIHWNSQDGCALFKLYASLCIKGMPSTSQNALNRAFIFINLKIISELLFNDWPRFTPFSPSTVSLTFHLCQPPDLVLPKIFTGFGHGAKDLMRSL